MESFICLNFILKWAIRPKSRWAGLMQKAKQVLWKSIYEKNLSNIEIILKNNFPANAKLTYVRAILLANLLSSSSLAFTSQPPLATSRSSRPSSSTGPMPTPETW